MIKRELNEAAEKSVAFSYTNFNIDTLKNVNSNLQTHKFHIFSNDKRRNKCC